MKFGASFFLVRRGVPASSISFPFFFVEKPTHAVDWQLIRGHWRADEVMDSSASSTFLAIAQKAENLVRADRVKAEDLIVVYTVVLPPTGRAKHE